MWAQFESDKFEIKTNRENWDLKILQKHSQNNNNSNNNNSYDDIVLMRTLK